MRLCHHPFVPLCRFTDRAERPGARLLRRRRAGGRRGRDPREDQGHEDQRLDHCLRMRPTQQRHLHAAACARIFPGPVNVPQEAMYWRTGVDGAGHTLSGEHDYILHFPPGGLPPNDAFWSLTMADEKQHFVANPIDRYSLGDRSGLAQNPDGSVDIYLRTATPAGHQSNWLPAPAGRFNLWLRVYLPGAAILHGEYAVPPVVEARPSR